VKSVGVDSDAATVWPTSTLREMTTPSIGDRRTASETCWRSRDAGAGALERGGDAYPPATKALCARSAAVLFGAVGDPRLDAGPVGKRPADAILGLRKDFDLFANLRPVRLIEGLEAASTLKPGAIGGLDLGIVRETACGR